MDATVSTQDRPGWLKRVAIGRNPRVTFVRIGILVVTVCLLRWFVFVPIRVKGFSMFPTYKDGQVNAVNRLAYMFHEPRRGDVVAIRYSGPHMMLMKRIVGLPGETISFRHGYVVINGRQLDEPYLKELPNDWEQERRTLGPQEYYVVGDNRSMPLIDHYEGRAERKRIIGRVLL